jgi:hypothetical protein
MFQIAAAHNKVEYLELEEAQQLSPSFICAERAYVYQEMHHSSI